MNQLKWNTDKAIALGNGVVIPAIPLALNKNRKLDERRQRALLRYYLDAGAGGLAVAVHTTQFEIRLPEIGLFRPILELAKEEHTRFIAKTKKPIILISGVIGQTGQAVKEARLAADLGYDAVLLSLAALREASNPELLNHCRAIAEIIPVIGFYLQPAVGGRKLNVDFWREFARIDNVVAVKIAPFNRYQTLDVVRGVIESGRAGEIALYTGNDDNIIPDLLTEYKMSDGNKIVSKRIVGGLLGHWAVWTKKAVELLDEIHTSITQNKDIRHLLAKGVHVTDCNAAFFDSANNYAGCITGIHEVLRRQGLLEGIWTLNEKDILSPGQKEEIDRVYKAYPELNDDAFIAENQIDGLNKTIVFMNEKLPIVLRSIQPEDISNCKLLSDAEGWNQTDKEWKLLVGNPQNVCLLAENGREIIGTATAMNYSGKVAWIGMVLVDKSFRGRGVGKMLISNLLNRLNSFTSVKLDATPAGQPLYEKFGFKKEFLIHRMTTLSLDNFQSYISNISPESIQKSEIQEVVTFDTSIFGADRMYLLQTLINEYLEYAWCIKRNGRITAFVLGRQGAKYMQIGPVFAPTIEEAMVLISHILVKHTGQPVVVDVHADKIELIAWLNKIGFTRQRDFVRMYLNQNLCPGNPEKQFLICGPEFG